MFFSNCSPIQSVQPVSICASWRLFAIGWHKSITASCCFNAPNSLVSLPFIAPPQSLEIRIRIRTSGPPHSVQAWSPVNIRTVAIAKISVENPRYADKLNGKNTPHPGSAVKKMCMSLASFVNQLIFDLPLCEMTHLWLGPLGALSLKVCLTRKKRGERVSRMQEF